MSRPPLRRSLLWWMLALTAVALAVAGTVSAVALRAYLVERTDDQLRVAGAFAVQRAPALLAGDERGGGLKAVLAPSDYVVEIRDADGTLTRLGGLAGLPAETLLDRWPTGAAGPVTTAGGAYRAVTVHSGDAVILVAFPLAPMRQTLTRLILVEVAAGLLVLVLQGLAGRMLLARGLRPLNRITTTAVAIAAGDPGAVLDRRVPVERAVDDRTEVGRLTLAVNGMLGRIETALAARARSEERLRRFIADASHELRTPLTTIRGYLQVLRQGMVTDADRPEVLRRADAEATRMAKIVEDLLYLARLDTEPALRHEPVDLVVVARDSLSDALAVQPGRPATLDAPRTCPVPGDPDALRQVFANLLANVRMHTPPQTPVRVTVECAAGTARVTVADDGPGVPAALAGQLFDRFSRGDRRGPGSGLGLAIVAEIVAAHEGTVTVDSPPGGGTAVRLTVPAPNS
ncbi:sensor histidine kinase [Virgisporangium aliadipatigenens]|uniref:sensor histidine kinase n=1 Tax=Virgisporangium aliadipatigenens TaxID=741659 RepID=UPI001942606B|nr:HAMP domain-containing sensor histidine kinase [Virgisporangium aliadipatigenens]